MHLTGTKKEVGAATPAGVTAGLISSMEVCLPSALRCAPQVASSDGAGCELTWLLRKTKRSAPQEIWPGRVPSAVQGLVGVNWKYCWSLTPRHHHPTRRLQFLPS